MEFLHPGARWIFRIRGYFAGLFLFIFAFGFLFLFSGLLVVIFFYLGFIIVIVEAYARMAYNQWKYEFTPTNLKLERGIIWKRYSNIPYTRVQNVDIHRGILARIFGFSTINIQTAGYSGYGGYGAGRMSEGHIPAVSPKKAEQIRDFLMKKISKHNEQGM